MTLALLANCRIRHALSCQPALILLSHLHRALLDLWQEPSLRHNIREAAHRYVEINYHPLCAAKIYGAAIQSTFREHWDDLSI